MSERQIGIGCVYAGVLWGTAIALTMMGSAVALMAHSNRGLELALLLVAHGLLCTAAAATLTVRNMLKRQTRLLRGAFDLGKEASSVRRLPGY